MQIEFNRENWFAYASHTTDSGTILTLHTKNFRHDSIASSFLTGGRHAMLAGSGHNRRIYHTGLPLCQTQDKYLLS